MPAHPLNPFAARSSTAVAPVPLSLSRGKARDKLQQGSQAVGSDGPIEHLASVRDLKDFLVEETITRRRELERLETMAAAPGLSPASANTLQHKAQDVRHEIERLEKACGEAYSCNPWRYEPELLDKLMSLRSSGASSAAIDRIRGLIRAGSWMHYPRIEERSIIEDVRRLRRVEPTLGPALDEVERLVTAHVLGAALEPAVRTIEDLSLRTWLMLKKADQLSGQVNSVTSTALRTELDDLRAVRDTLYFRCLYPTIAKKGFI